MNWLTDEPQENSGSREDVSVGGPNKPGGISELQRTSEGIGGSFWVQAAEKGLSAEA